MYKKSRYCKTINIIYLFNHCKYTIFSVTLHYLNETITMFLLWQQADVNLHCCLFCYIIHKHIIYDLYNDTQ